MRAEDHTPGAEVKEDMRAKSLLPILLMAATAAAQDAPRRITPQQAKDFRGTLVTVCGRIDGVSCDKGVSTRLSFTSLGLSLASATEAPTSIVFTDDRLRVASSSPPDQRFDRQLVCATGLTRQGPRGEEVVVDDPSRIWVEESITPPLATHAHWPCEDGVTMPVVLKAEKASYTPEAMRKRAAGTVRMQAVVEADGRVGNVRVTRAVDPDLDVEAMRVLKLWQFRPGTFMGEPAAIVVTTDITFTIRQRANP